ncbi:MAG: hypothetical protein Q8Q09_26205 [Deltaproteobacteria bacterium]|nr:hypothetical protein [Deltaproteobacteria bacterium]
MIAQRVDLVLQFTLAAAGQLDAGERELNATQLLKVLYLVDLAHAGMHEGRTFTEIHWVFGHYGPYALEAHARIAPVVRKTGATSRGAQPKATENHAERYELQDDDLLRASERQLPTVVTSAVRRAVRTYRRDLHKLLHAVYQSAPMLRAAPDELLQFAGLAVSNAAPTMDAKSLSEKEQRRRRDKLDGLRQRVAESMAARLSRTEQPVAPAPRYDALFVDGLAWIDQQNSHSIETGSHAGLVGESVWHSEVRRDGMA